MKFELKPDPRSTTDVDFLRDVKRVAEQLKKQTVTAQEYRNFGKYGWEAVRNRFGRSWVKVLQAAGLNLARSKLNIPPGELLEDLRRIASLLSKETLTQQEYKDHGGRFSCQTICRRFGGSWSKAVESIGLKRSREYGLTDEEYFRNLEEIWIKLGRQPFYGEIEKPLSKYSAGAYERRFGSWRKALETFVSYMNPDETEQKADVSVNDLSSMSAIEHPKQAPSREEPQSVHKTKRQVSDRLRFRVFYRDGMSCQICGKSRVKYHELELVVDHKFPWSKGGETVFENLQTLCRPCNGGKGDLGQSD